ncbi:hypothetical protein MPSEU_000123800 [Mayamaea pseudoterrestris]|nr:hypothetical protein MPSEU_000123800 [Mayamaea pseudoterrestris]
MAVTDDMENLSSSSHHRRIMAESASQQPSSSLFMNPRAATKSNDGSYTSVETHSEAEDEAYLANDPYLAELLNSNHSRTSNLAGGSSSHYTQRAVASHTISSLSAHEATRTWNDLSSVHSNSNYYSHAGDHNDSSSSSCLLDNSTSTFGGSEDGNNASGDYLHHHDHDDDNDDNDADLMLQKQAFQKLFDGPRQDKDMIMASTSNTSNSNHAAAANNSFAAGNRRSLMHRSASVRVRPTYHGPKLGLIEENSLH